MGWWTGSAERATAVQLDRLERKVDAILTHMGVVVPEPTYPEVAEHVARGEGIKAVKAYREATGAGLVEAQKAVERMAEDRR